MPTVTHHGDYQKITLGDSEHVHVTVGPGETVARRVYDQTASNAWVTFDVTGGTLEHIGVLGAYPPGLDAMYGGSITICRVAVADGETAAINHCDFTDGATASADGTANVRGIHVDADHAGHATIRNVGIAEMSDGGILTAAPGDDTGAGGTVTVENCYVADCCYAGISLGTTTSVAKACVVVVNDTPGGPESQSTDTYRGLYGEHTVTTGAECALSVPSARGPAADAATGATLFLRDGHLSGVTDGNVIQERQGSSPTTTPQRWVPASPFDAATGDSFIPGALAVPDGQGGANTHPVPTYDPERVGYPALRTEDPDGQVRAVAVTTPRLTPTRAPRVRLPAGAHTYSVALDDPILTSFEAGPTGWPGPWAGDLTDWAVDSQYAMDGRYSLRYGYSTDSTDWRYVHNPEVTTFRGTSYSALVRFRSTETEGGLNLHGCVQDGTPGVESYAAQLRLSQNVLAAVKFDPDGDQYAETELPVDVTAGDAYRLWLDLGETTVTARLTDPYTTHEEWSATLIDGEYQTGTLGLGSFAPVRFDRLMQHGPPADEEAHYTPIATFESGVLAAWRSDDWTSFSLQTDHVRRGSFALQYEPYNAGSDYLWSMPGDGLGYYPQPGDSFQFYVQPNALDDYHREELVFAKQSTGSNKNNSYGINIHSDGRFYLAYYRPDGAIRIAESAPQTYERGVWHRVEIDWHSRTALTARLYNDETGDLKATITPDLPLDIGRGGLQITSLWNRNAPAYYDHIIKTN